MSEFSEKMGIEVGNAFKSGYNCSEAIVEAFRKYAGVNIDDNAFRLASGFGGGIGHARNICGALVGCTMVISTLIGRNTPEEKEMPAMSDTEDYEVRESDESIQSSETEEVEQFAEEIKNDVLKHDWDALSEKISYPIAINGTTVNNREDFLKLDIDGKLNQEFVEAIRAETCRKMFCNWQGVMMGDGQIWFDNVYKGTGPWKLSIIGINNMLETESENLNAEETIEPDSETADGSVDELSMDEIKELLFGEWKVTKLLGFTQVQNDYTNYPEGHDIIGNHIVINEEVFSSEGLEKYERYQCEILEPSYEVSPIKERNLIYNVKEAIKEDPELYDWILNCGELQDLKIRGTRDGIKGKSPAVDIMLSSDKQFVILTMDCAFYLLEKE